MQVLFIHDDDVIQQFTSGATDPSLCSPVLPWAPKRCPLGLGSKVLDRCGNPVGKNGIIIVDEEPWRGFVWERLAELLNNPCQCGMCGDAEVQNLSSPMIEDEPGVEKSEPNGRDDEEVHRGDAMFVISEKRLPPLTLIVVRISLR